MSKEEPTSFQGIHHKTNHVEAEAHDDQAKLEVEPSQEGQSAGFRPSPTLVSILSTVTSKKNHHLQVLVQVISGFKSTFLEPKSILVGGVNPSEKY